MVFIPPQSSKSLRKQQRHNLLSDRSEIKGLGIYFAKDRHHPQVTKSLVYIEVINFCGSQPCFPSRGQRYYGLIELEPRTSVRKLLSKFYSDVPGWANFPDLLAAVAHKLLDPQITLQQNGGRGPYFPGNYRSTQSRR